MLVKCSEIRLWKHIFYPSQSAVSHLETHDFPRFCPPPPRHLSCRFSWMCFSFSLAVLEGGSKGHCSKYIRVNLEIKVLGSWLQGGHLKHWRTSAGVLWSERGSLAAIRKILLS